MLGDVFEGRAAGRMAGKLKEMLQDEDRHVVRAALRALWRLRAFDSPRVFARFVDSDDEVLALTAIRALGDAGDPEGFKRFRAKLDSENENLALAAIEATSKLGEPALARHLVAQLAAKSVPRRVAAIRAIAALNAEAHAPELHALLQAPEGPVRQEALAALLKLAGGRFESEYLHALDDPDHTVRRVGAQAIGRLGLEEHVGRLYALFSDPHLYVREDAVDGMVAMATQEAVELARRGLSSEAATVRACSSQTLGRLESDAGIEAHIALLTDRHVPARRWAAWALGEIGRTEASEALSTCAARQNQDQQTRACAFLSLGKLGHEPSAAQMSAVVAAKPTTAGPGAPLPLRIAAVRALGLMKHGASAGMLAGRLDDIHGEIVELDEIRAEAAIALGRIGSAGHVGLLTQYMNATGEPKVTYQVRPACQWAIMKITGEKLPLDLPPRYRTTPAYFIRYRRPSN